MTVKRFLEDRAANCFMIFSSMAGSSSGCSTTVTAAAVEGSGRIFTCKTCNKEFPSFQALGGHRASHKRPRLMAAAENLYRHNSKFIIGAVKDRRHECSICGIEFATGQALGGHMRRHRNDQDAPVAAAVEIGEVSHTQSDCTTETATFDSSRKDNSGGGSGSGGNSRVLLLDLNLTPYENVLKFGKLDSLS